MRTWREIASSQDHVIGREQALSAGLSRHAWDWQLAEKGHWTRLCDGVAMTHSGTPTERQLWWAAVLKAGKGAALSGDAALTALGLTGLKTAWIDVAIPRERQVEDFKVGTTQVRVHRVAGVDRWNWTQRGLSMTNIHASALLAGAWTEKAEVAERRIAMTVQQQLCAVVTFRQLLAQMPKHPRRALLLIVFDDVEHGAHASSELEFLRFCRKHGIPEPDDLQLKVRASGTKYLDARYRAQRVSLEVDGGYHREAETWDADALRTLELAVANKGTSEQQIRVTCFNMRHREARTARLLKALLVDV